MYKKYEEHEYKELGRGASVIAAFINLVNGELSRRATAQLEDRRQQFQKEQGEQQKNFQREQFKQQKKLQLELAAENRKTQLELAAEQRKTALQLEQARQVFTNWPLRTKAPADILMKYDDDKPIPLNLILAPPVVDYDKYGTQSKKFPPLELGLADGLRQFLGKHYSAHSSDRPIVLLDGVWDSKRYHGGGTIELLHDWLKSEPILIVESIVDGNELNLRVAYWGQGQEQHSYESISPKLPYWEIIGESVKARALKWKETREQLEALGKSAEEIDRLGGDNAFNLKLLEEEEQLRQHGIDTTTLAIEKQYKIDGEKDITYLRQCLVTYHCLVAGWMADIHYLVYEGVPPLLPQLLPELTKDFHEPKLLEAIVLGYQKVYQVLENERPAWIPELSLELADSIKYLPDRTWARQQVDNSIESWLKIRGVTLEEGANLIEAIKSVLEPEDWDYLKKIGNCLSEVGDWEAAAEIEEIINNKAQAYYNRGITLAAQEKYKEAIEDYDEAISLDRKHTAAYYYKGLAQDKLKQYQEALESYKQGLDNSEHNSFEQAKTIFQPDMAEEELFYLGCAFSACERLGEKAWEEARKCFQELKKINPNYYPPNNSEMRQIWEKFIRELGEIPIPSDRGINYSRLRNFLIAGKWWEASEETKDRIAEVVGKNLSYYTLKSYDATEIPRLDLETIDRLWREYSGGRFGFSVQYNIYQSASSIRIDDEYKVQGENSSLRRKRIKRINFGIVVGWCAVIEWDYEEYPQESYEEFDPLDFINITTFNTKDSDRDLVKVKIGWWEEVTPASDPEEGFFPVLDRESPTRRMQFLESLFDKHYSYFASSI